MIKLENLIWILIEKLTFLAWWLKDKRLERYYNGKRSL